MKVSEKTSLSCEKPLRKVNKNQSTKPDLPIAFVVFTRDHRTSSQKQSHAIAKENYIIWTKIDRHFTAIKFKLLASCIDANSDVPLLCTTVRYSCTGVVHWYIHWCRIESCELPGVLHQLCLVVKHKLLQDLSIWPLDNSQPLYNMKGLLS